MRVAWKFAFGLTLCIGLVLAAQGMFHLRRLAALQERELRDDQLILSGTLAAAVEDLWAGSGPVGANAFLARVRSNWPRSAIRLRMASEFESNVALPTSPIITDFRRDEEWFVSAQAPVTQGGEVVAMLLVSRDLPSESAFASEMLQRQIAFTAVGAVLAGLLSVLLWMTILGRPLRDLTTLAQEVAEGDFSRRAGYARRDEVGRLAQAFDEMSAKLEQARTRVVREQRARTATLEELRHADRLTLVGRLASSIAHELGTPLNVVSGRAMMVAMDETLTDEVRENGNIIAQQAQHMAGLIRDLLNLSRKHELVREAVVVREVVDGAVGLLEPICEDRRVDIAVGGREDLRAFIDRSRILQVLTNLMMNAVQAMPQGGTLTLRLDGEVVDEPRDRHATPGAYVRIAIADEGAGIKEEALEHIFEPFFTTKGEGEGTGLGLTVSHDIVREHGGFMEVTSELGHGTTFFVYLPNFQET